MFIPIPVLIAALVIGLVIYGLLRLRGDAAARDPLETMGADWTRRGTAGGGAYPTPAELEAQVRLLLEHDRKIEAIELVRQSTGMGLKDARDFVERL